MTVFFFFLDPSCEPRSTYVPWTWLYKNLGMEVTNFESEEAFKTSLVIQKRWVILIGDSLLSNFLSY